MRAPFAHIRATVCIVALALLWGCSDDNKEEPVDPTPDPQPGMDGGMDAEPEPQPDVIDPMPDAMPDAMPDPTPDPMPDADVVIECGDLPDDNAGACAIAAGDANLRIRGQILSPEGVLNGGEVLIDGDGAIVCAACDCSGEAGFDTATVVTCPQGVVTPGIINAHDHITFTQNRPGNWGEERYEHRHDWRRGLRGHTEINAAGRANGDEVAWGEMRQVLGGTTSLAGSGATGGFLRNIDRGSNQEGLGQGEAELDTFPLGDTGGQLRNMGCSYPDLPDPSVLQEDAYVPHVSEGIDREARNEFLCLSSNEGGGVDVTEDKSAFIHGVGLLPVDGRELAVSGTSIVWSPRSNISLYGHTAPVTMLDRQGVLLSMGTDWTPSGSVNMLRELACADLLNRDYYNGHFSDRDLWLMATANAAESLGVDDAIGSLTVGHTADIAIFDNSDGGNAYRAIVAGTPEDVQLVLRAGEPLYGLTSLMSVIPGGQEGCEPMTGDDICVSDRSICAQRETGSTLAQLAAANQGNYGLVFCGVPDNEPTCVPSRPGEFDGSVTEDDTDGDGIANDLDNCPRVFNPIRPLDGDVQGDHDGDGDGDVCDPCPVDPDTEDCTVPDPADRDADGVANLDDNCPSTFNPDQNDGDSDGKGDLCDPCPDDANPGQQGCPVSIYDLKTGVTEQGSRVAISGVVSAVASPRFFVQVPEADRDDTQGADFSGIFVFIPGENPDGHPIPAVGDTVEVDASFGDFFGQLQLSTVTRVEILTTGGDSPVPVEADEATMATGGDRADELEAVLVKTECEVTGLNPPAGPGDDDPTNAYVCEGGLRVNDLIFATDPFPRLGDVLEVTGVLRFANGDSKLEPRSAEDVRFLRTAPPELVSFSAPTVFTELGGPAATIPVLEVSIDRPAPADGVVVSLANSAPDLMTAPETVTILEGETSAEIQVTGLEASENFAILTATLGESAPLTVNVRVLAEDRVPSLVSVDPQDATIVLGTTTMTVTLDIPAPADGLIVDLLASPGDFVEIDQTFAFEPRALTGTFDITGLAAGVETITIGIGDDQIQTTVTVVETPPVGLVISEVYYDAPSGDDGLEWVEIFNGTNVEIDLSGYSLGSGGNNLSTSVVQLAGTLQPGQCFVVGGPTAADNNGTPTYDQVFDFEPDLQNSGATADAIALFDVTADQINGSAVPVDAVIYGGENGNDLIDETGAPGEVDVADAESGSSIERTGDGWRVQVAPTPNDCDALSP